MFVFITGLVVFFGAHFYSAVRSRDVDRDIKVRMGYGPFMGLYSLVSIVGLALIVYGYGLTRGAGVLYTPPVWTSHINLVLMLPALILLVASQLPPGWIKRVSKHPMLVAVKLWAVGHLLANGEQNSVLLFGSFLAFAVFDRIAVKRRAGEEGPVDEGSIAMDTIALIAGVALYVAIYLWLHPILFGVRVVS